MRATRRGLTYLLLVLPLDVLTAALLLAGLVVSTALQITPLGMWLLALVLRAASGLGRRRRRLVARLLDEQVPAPPLPRRDGGVLAWRRAVLADPAHWRAVGYALVKLPLSIVSLAVGTGGYVFGLVTLTYYPLQDRSFGPWWLIGLTWLTGLVLLVAGPWLTRSVVALERLLVRGLLGPSRAAQRIADLRETRDRAVADADTTLRRIERDLHDGAQARLIGVGMQLTMVRELLTAGAPPETVRSAVDTAQTTLTEAVTELRDLVRGIHPPVLDRGLEAALTTVAAGSAVPVTLEIDLPRRPSPAIESIVYFTACELLTNAGRHSGARTATIQIKVKDDKLQLLVRDDGRGGAAVFPGGGLAGLIERVRMVDGTLVVDSPPAGPTTVTVEIPGPI